MIANTYRLQEQIGEGSFGCVYRAEDIITGENVAVKVVDSCQQFIMEEEVYSVVGGAIGFAKMYWHGPFRNGNCLVISLLDKSLDQLHRMCNKKFSLKTTLMLAEQMLLRFEYLHKCGYIIRDAKPENFMFMNNTVFMIDFGLAKRYIDETSGEHIRCRENGHLAGTWRYISINTHLSIEQSRRDDLESLGYILVYFIKGKLPWQGVKGSEKRQKVAEIKMTTSIDSICSGLPSVFSEYLRAVKSLKFDEEPNYALYRNMFREQMIQNGYSYDLDFDWNRGVVTLPKLDLPPIARTQKEQKTSSPLIRRPRFVPRRRRILHTTK